MDYFNDNQYYFQNDDYYFTNDNFYSYQYPFDTYDSYLNYQMFVSPEKDYDQKIKRQKSNDSDHRHHKLHDKRDTQVESVNPLYMPQPYQPVCIAIGDIEGDIHKLRTAIHFIKHTNYNFIFIGDIFDDISDSSPTRKQSFKCIEMVSEFFSPINEICDFTFKDIHFDEKNFSEIQNRVKFIAGNSECDVLKDIIETKKVKPNSLGKFVYGKGKYLKTFSEKQLTILYRYFKNCCGVITLTCSNQSKNKKSKKNFEFVDSVFFRHSPAEFDHSRRIICQMPSLKKHAINQDDCCSLLIVGHVHYFGPLLSSSPDCRIFSIDTTSCDKNRIYTEEDRRVAMICYDPITGFFVEPFYL